MGTSAGYDLPKGGDWTPLKNDANDFVKEFGQGSVSPGALLKSYLRANGGAGALAKGGGGTRPDATSNRGGGGGGSGGAARSVARGLGGFLSGVGESGLGAALRDIGLGSLIGKSAAEVRAGLFDELAGPASTLDEHAARLALAKWDDELLASAETYEDVERLLSTLLDDQGIVRILAKFFGNYLYERFCRDFYERWSKKVGQSKAAQSLTSIRDYVDASIKAKLASRDAVRVNWKGAEGLKLTEQVMQETLEIFEVPV